MQHCTHEQPSRTRSKKRPKSAIYATASLETVDLDQNKVDEFTITLDTDIFGRVDTVFDSGASICCIDQTVAYKYYRRYIRKERSSFDVRTANGDIQLRYYILAAINSNGKTHLAKWYLLPDSPFRFICSRKLFLTLGYKIMGPGEFNNKSAVEGLDVDLYDQLIKHIKSWRNLKCPKSRIKRTLAILNNVKLEAEGYPEDVRTIFRESPIRELCVIATFQPEQTEEKKEDPEPQIVAIKHSRDKPTINPEEEDEIEDNEPMDEDEVSDRMMLEICGSITKDSIKMKFKQLLEEHQTNYAKDSSDVGTIPGVEFEINLKPGAEPVHAKPYPLPYNQADEVNRQVQELLEARFIKPAENSPWASPTIIVPKPARQGKVEFRMCIDYRELNHRTVKDRYTIPSMRDLYRQLRGNTVFSNIDLRSGYHHIKIKESDQPKTAFITDKGTYIWRRMTFGFCNAPAVFQRAMNNIFHGLEFVIIYLDDVIICSRTEEEHFQHLKLVFQRIRKYNLKLRLIKCRFFMAEIKYLGLIVNKHGIKMDQEYVKKVLRMKVPTNHKELERYLGMVNWLGRFIPNLSKLTGHFSTFKNKSGSEWKWGKQENILFAALKEAIEKADILRHPDFQRPFYVQTDASDTAIGAVLLQDFEGPVLEPIEFASRKLHKNELNWHTSDKELVAVVFALNKWIRYLLPKHFIVFTDHRNLEELFKYGRRKKNQRLHRWIVMLQQFDFTAKYLPGDDNFIADYLSRDIIPNNKDEFIDEHPEIKIENTPVHTMAIIKAANPDRIWTMRTREPLELNEICALRRSIRTKGKPRPEYDEDKMRDAIWDPRFRNTTKDLKRNVLMKNQFKEPEIKMEIRKQSKLKKHKHRNQKKRKKWNKMLNTEKLSMYSKTDPELLQLRKKLDKGYTHKRYEYQTNDDGTIYIRRQKKNKQWKIYIPREMRPILLEYFHSDTNFHHQGMDRMEKLVRRRYYWPGMRQEIRNTIKKCKECTNARRRLKNWNKGKFQPILSQRPFEMICMDIVGPLPITSKENDISSQ